MRMSDVTQDTEITIKTQNGPVALSVATVLQWVAPNAPAIEAFKFLLFCKSTNLDPFLKEAELVPMGGRFAIVVSKAGWTRRMQEHPAYDGHEAGLILTDLSTGDTKLIEGSAFTPIAGQKWVISGGWCRIYRNDRKIPTYFAVSMAEYNKGTGTWMSMAATMIRKCAIVGCCREAFALTGYASEELELPEEVEQAKAIDAFPVSAPPAAFREPEPEAIVEVVPIEAPVEAPVSTWIEPPAPVKTDYPAEIRRTLTALGVDETHYQFQEGLLKRGVNRIEDLRDEDAMTILINLNKLLPPIQLDEDFPVNDQVVDVVVPDYARPAEKPKRTRKTKASAVESDITDSAPA
jgi:phage recombination protein Bet